MHILIHVYHSKKTFSLTPSSRPPLNGPRAETIRSRAVQHIRTTRYRHSVSGRLHFKLWISNKTGITSDFTTKPRLNPLRTQNLEVGSCSLREGLVLSYCQIVECLRLWGRHFEPFINPFCDSALDVINVVLQKSHKSRRDSVLIPGQLLCPSNIEPDGFKLKAGCISYRQYDTN